LFVLQKTKYQLICRRSQLVSRRGHCNLFALGCKHLFFLCLLLVRAHPKNWTCYLFLNFTTIPYHLAVFWRPLCCRIFFFDLTLPPLQIVYGQPLQCVKTRLIDSTKNWKYTLKVGKLLCEINFYTYKMGNYDKLTMTSRVFLNFQWLIE